MSVGDTFSSATSHCTAFHSNAGDWQYKAEGNSAVVWTYTGNDREFKGYVLRIRKRGPVAQITKYFHYRENVLKHILRWPSALNSASEGEKLCLPEDEQLVLLPKEVLEELDRKLGSMPSLTRTRISHPQCSIPGGLDLSSTSAILTRDYTLAAMYVSPPPGYNGDRESRQSAGGETISQSRLGVENGGNVWGVELKPKCGFLPLHSELTHPVKSKLPRYTLHQHLKHQQSAIPVLSAYDPRSLFSLHRSDSPGDCRGCAEVSVALSALRQNPQNNLRCFRDGVRLRGIDANVYIPEFVWTIVLPSILHETGVMNVLLQIQRLDFWDIEVLYPMICSHFLREKPQEDTQETVDAICKLGKSETFRQWLHETFDDYHWKSQGWLDALHRFEPVTDCRADDVDKEGDAERAFTTAAASESTRGGPETPLRPAITDIDAVRGSLQHCKDAVAHFLAAQSAKDASVLFSLQEIGNAGDELRDRRVASCEHPDSRCRECRTANGIESAVDPHSETWTTEVCCTLQSPFSVSGTVNCTPSESITGEVPGIKRVWRFAVGMVDLEPKCASKLPKYYELDRACVAAYESMRVEQNDER